MKLLTAHQRELLLSNGNKAAEKASHDELFDPKPVVMLYTLFHPCTWLLTQIDPKYPDLAFGLCDLGMGCPEIGSVSLAELAELKFGPAPMVERNRCFKPRTTLSGYAKEAKIAGKIIV